MKKYKEFNEKFNQDIIDELIEKGLENLTDEEKNYLNNPHKIDLKRKEEKKVEVKKDEKDEKTKNLIDKWKQQGDDDKKEWSKNANKNLIKTIDVTKVGATVLINWIELYYFIEENYTDFNKSQIYEIIKNILDAKIVHYSSDDEDTDFIFIDKEYTRDQMVWFNVGRDSSIKTACVKFNEYEKFWIPRLLNAHNFQCIRIEDYKNRK